MERRAAIKTVEGEVRGYGALDDEELEDKERSHQKRLKHGNQFKSRQSWRASAHNGLQGLDTSLRQRARGGTLATEGAASLLQDLRLNLDDTTMYTIEQIDVCAQGKSDYRAFGSGQTTPVYSGLLRMADLLRAGNRTWTSKLHIVAPDERVTESSMR